MGSELYSDLAPNSQGKVFDIDARIRSVNMIITTPLNQRLNRPWFGIDLDDEIFELFNEETTIRLKNAVYEALHRFDPHIKMVYSESIFEPNMNARLYRVKIVFKIEGLGEDRFEVTGNMRQ